MKKYIAPISKYMDIDTEDMLQDSNGGVATGCSLGDEFIEEDVSYSKQFNFFPEDEEEE